MTVNLQTVGSGGSYLCVEQGVLQSLHVLHGIARREERVDAGVGGAAAADHTLLLAAVFHAVVHDEDNYTEQKLETRV